MKNLLYAICLLLYIYSNAQIAITELYYDTPFSETATQNDRHHAGEYIELFNFTTEDINIGGWYLADEEGSFHFPPNTIIPSNGLILVAYLPNDTQSYIPNFFPSTQGKEAQIFYQKNMELNNYKEEVSLYMTSIRDIILPRHQKLQTHEINLPLPYVYTTHTLNQFDPNANTQGYNYYKKSLQIQNQLGFQENILITQPEFTNAMYRTATPLALDFPYTLVPLESLESVIDAILNNYDHFIGNSGVLDLLNNVCDKYVALISENVISHPVVSERCPEYDAAGNFIGLLATCPEDRPANNDEDESPELIAQEDFSSKVWVAPNPTRSVSTIFWEKDIEDLIAEIIVVPVNGGQYIPISYSNINASAGVNLSTYPSGIYVVRFTFTSGQVVTKSLIKI